VGVEVTEKQRLQLGFFLARAFLNSNDTVMSVQRQAKRPKGRILMESSNLILPEHDDDDDDD